MSVEERFQTKAKCITDKCKNKQASRGLCRSCLNWVYKAKKINSKIDTQLVDLGLMLPSLTMGRKKNNHPLLVAYKAKTGMDLFPRQTQEQKP